MGRTLYYHTSPWRHSPPIEFDEDAIIGCLRQNGYAVIPRDRLHSAYGSVLVDYFSLLHFPEEVADHAIQRAGQQAFQQLRQFVRARRFERPGPLPRDEKLFYTEVTLVEPTQEQIDAWTPPSGDYR